MKKQLINLILSLIILAISGCKLENDPAPLKFKSYEHNPILTPGEPGSWDDLAIALPHVVKHDAIFYLFYLGINRSGVPAMGLATSNDGFHFTKFEGNPVLAPDGIGSDAFGLGAGIVIKQDSAWVIYFNCIERASWGPGGSIGRASARELTGPWIKDNNPVLIAGRMGEWDSEYLFPGSVLKLDDGSYRMYYSGGADFSGSEYQYLGMANSTDGKKWRKYNDPATKEHPFAESDPVLKTGTTGEWDSKQVWTPCVLRNSNGYEMYYAGVAYRNNVRIMAAGYATSHNGIIWEKFPGNPVFETEYDLSKRNDIVEITFEGPSVIFLDSICFMYYDYAIVGNVGGKIGLAKAVVKDVFDSPSPFDGGVRQVGN
jgi:hypothetical protein